MMPATMSIVRDTWCRYCSPPPRDRLTVNVCRRCAEVEPLIVEKLGTGTLDSPDGFEEAFVFMGTVLVCSGCSEPIVQSQWTYPALQRPLRMLRFHRWCARIWEVVGMLTPQQDQPAAR